MTTLGQLIDGIHSSLHSYTGVHEQVGWLTVAATSGGLSLTASPTEGNIRGIAEIESELIYVVSASGATLTLAPFGRGYRGTTAAAHAINAKVTFDPAFPRVEIRRAIEQQVQAMASSLFAVDTVDLVVEANRVGYVLPATVDRVLRVEVKVAGDAAEDNWVDYARWDFAPTSPVDVNGKVINFYKGLPIGSECRVTYASKFGTFATEADALSSVGLLEEYADLITYGVTSRMIRFVEPARIQLSGVENVARAQVIQAGDAGRLANQLFAMYQTRLAEERRRLLDLHPAQNNFLGR